MARLSRQQAIDRIKQPVNARYIRQAIEQEDRLTFHAEPIQDVECLPTYAYQRFMGWVESFLPKDKFLRFKQLMTTPVETVQSCKSIFDELSRVFDAQDKYVKFDFSSEAMSSDFMRYQEKLKNEHFWKTKGFDALKTGINSFLIVDLPAVQVTSRPEPYYYLLDIRSVVDVDIDTDTQTVEYICFKQKNNAVAVFDSEHYRMFKKNEQTGEYDILSEVPHTIYDDNGVVISGLGYTPACDFYGTYIKDTRGINKRGPLTDSLGKLDWLLFWRTSVRYFQLYAAWPIIVTYKSDCQYKDDMENVCHDGIVSYEIERDGRTVTEQYLCPACQLKGKDNIGAGTYWEVDAPADSSDVDMLKNPVFIVEVSNAKLEYAIKEIERLENEIYLNGVGYDGETLNNQAVNVSQVRANFESKESVLDNIKYQYERVDKFGMDTCCRQRYERYFLGSVVNYGNDYFLKTVTMLIAEHEAAKKNGMPMFYIAMLRDMVAKTKYKNNPDQLMRVNILSQLEPYPDLTLEQLVEMGYQESDPEGFIIKSNFSTFIAQFERENTSIMQFGSAIPFTDKIKAITKILISYATTRQKPHAPGARNDTRGNAGTPAKTA